MRVPFEWLKEFIDIKDSADEVAHRLTLIGLEVEAMEPQDADVVFEVNVTPNRPDCLSILGIARELSAAIGTPLRFPEHEIKEEILDVDFKVEILDSELCHRYAGRIVKGIEISQAPEWMKKRLEKCGIRSINNIVDTTNYVLLELGHPLHAFDLGKLKGKTIKVGTAGEGNKIVTLDCVERELPAESLLIWDIARPIAVAGVMGGDETEVTDSTRDVFLESAYFNPRSIRRTSKSLGLRSESSYRFERGTDIEMLDKALDRAAFLMKQIAGGEIHKKIDVYPGRFISDSITVRYDKVNRVLGTNISSADMINIIKRLNLNFETNRDYFTVKPPSFRTDLKRDTDVIEEIARLYGYDRIPITVPRANISAGKADRKRTAILGIKEAMRKAGFNEAINYSFMNEADLDILDIPAEDRRRKVLAIKNPLRKEDSLLRTTLVSSLVENFVYNFSRGTKDIRIFEVSKVFENIDRPLPLEILTLGGIYYKEKSPSLWKETAGDFYLVKGVIESLFDDLKIRKYSFSLSCEPFLHPGQSSDIYVSGLKVGFLGILSPAVIERFGVKISRPEVAIFEIDMDQLISLIPGTIMYTPVPKFPHVERDIAIVVDENIKAADIMNAIRAYPSELIEEVSIFDFYKGKNIPEGKKSLAFNIRYRSKDRTLTDEEVETLHNNLVKYLTEKTGGDIRR